MWCISLCMYRDIIFSIFSRTSRSVFAPEFLENLEEMFSGNWRVKNESMWNDSMNFSCKRLINYVSRAKLKIIAYNASLDLFLYLRFNSFRVDDAI